MNNRSQNITNYALLILLCYFTVDHAGLLKHHQLPKQKKQVHKKYFSAGNVNGSSQVNYHLIYSEARKRILQKND